MPTENILQSWKEELSRTPSIRLPCDTPQVGVNYVQDEATLNSNTLITVSSFWPNYNHHTRLHLTSCDRLYNHDVTTNVGLTQYQLLPLRTIKAYILVMLFICWNNYGDGPGENQITLSLW